MVSVAVVAHVDAAGLLLFLRRFAGFLDLFRHPAPLFGAGRCTSARITAYVVDPIVHRVGIGRCGTDYWRRYFALYDFCPLGFIRRTDHRRGDA